MGKITHCTEFTKNVKIEGNLKVQGKLNFGQGTTTQITSSTTSVSVNSASGVITLMDDANVRSEFVVVNNHVTAGSVVILTPSNPGIQPCVKSVSDGSFTISTNTFTTGQKIYFLVC